MHPDEPAVNNWRATDSDFFTEGEGGAGLAIARLGRVPSWPRTGHEAAKGRHQPANRAFCSLSVVCLSDLIFFVYKQGNDKSCVFDRAIC